MEMLQLATGETGAKIVKFSAGKNQKVTPELLKLQPPESKTKHTIPAVLATKLQNHYIN